MNLGFGGSGADPQSFGAPPLLMCAQSSPTSGGFGAAAAAPLARFGSAHPAVSQMHAFSASPQLRSSNSPMNFSRVKEEKRRYFSQKMGAPTSVSTEVDSTVQVHSATTI